MEAKVDRGAAGKMVRARAVPATATDPAPALESPEALFEATYRFAFDPFQRRGVAALASGSSVLVAAPTGAGKTVVGEFAAWAALSSGGKTFYTTPIKALSNQKYADFVALHGTDNVGLLTGDNSVNGDAPIVVMTTEVLRNMIYEDSAALDQLRYVVLDEVHYLQDRYRGAVWEEILIHLPVEVQIASLSATVSNAEEFANWMQTIRGRTEVIIEDRRPVDIRHWYYAADELMPMFIRRADGEPIPNPRAREFDRRPRRGAERPGRGGKRPRRKRRRAPLRTEVIDRLAHEQMLPGIYFIFSRRGCDDAVKQCIHDGVRLTSSEERRSIVAQAHERIGELSPDELDVLGYDDWIEGLRRGVAAHHAGMIPAFKETVEKLFNQGLVKVVFATETLALGINMPARTVVIESLMKYTGEKHELITPGQFAQLTGRAGRRGIDALGHCVVLLQRYADFDQITRLATTRTYPLRSSFTPSYNMAVNLVRNYDQDEAEHLVNSSFAQFQADRDVVQLEQTKERLEGYLASYRERMTCDRGDFPEYWSLRERLRREESSPDEVHADERREAARRRRMLAALASLRPGDVVDIPQGRRAGTHVVVGKVWSRSGKSPRITTMSSDRAVTRFAVSDFAQPPRALARLPLPAGFDVRDARARRALARRLDELDPATVDRGAVEGDDRYEKGAHELRRAVESHPCHGCPELSRHIHFVTRARRLEREIGGIERRIGSRTGTLALRFERVLEVLEELGFVSEWTLTDKGETLARVYNEADLLVVEALRAGIFDHLDPPELAALLSTVIYEPRGPETSVSSEQPTRAAARAWSRLERLWRDIRAHESSRGLELTRAPDPGFAEPAYLWAQGVSLEDVLGPDDAPGDFVRSIKQLVDLLRQLAEITPEERLARGLADCIARLHRGVVAYSSLEI
jgi:ATP-dependent RNA helicase HelY